MQEDGAGGGGVMVREVEDSEGHWTRSPPPLTFISLFSPSAVSAVTPLPTPPPHLPTSSSSEHAALGRSSWRRGNGARHASLARCAC